MALPTNDGTKRKSDRKRIPTNLMNIGSHPDGKSYEPSGAPSAPRRQAGVKLFGELDIKLKKPENTRAWQWHKEGTPCYHGTWHELGHDVKSPFIYHEVEVKGSKLTLRGVSLSVSDASE